MLAIWPAWIALWMIAIVVTIRDLRLGRYSLVVWLVPWVVLGLEVVIYGPWLIFGREIITADASQLTVRRKLFGIEKSRVYRTRTIRNLRIEGPFGLEARPNWYGLGYAVEVIWHSGTVRFEYLGKTRRFGSYLEESEAAELLEKLREYLPEAAFADGEEPWQDSE
jgi:hypothetical protein